MSLYSLADLCDLADVTARTVRFYIAQGLLRGPESSGPSARYDDGHLDRLRLIRRLQRDNVPLAEIRKRLAALSDQDIAELGRATPAVRETAAEYIASVLAGKGVGGRSTTPVAPPPDPAMAPSMPGPAAPTHRVEASVLLAPPDQAGTERSQWERVGLGDGVELHVRRPQTREGNRRIQRLIENWHKDTQEDR